MGAVQRTSEFRRILDLPRRTWSAEDALDLAKELTALLRAPGGEQTLFPNQAIALVEATQFGGAIVPLRVAAGKTLISLLLPIMFGSLRPLLLLPAKLVGKTERALRDLAQHWALPNHLQIKSYQWLGTVYADADERIGRLAFFDSRKPDLVIADEAHWLKNPKAAVTRKVFRYLYDTDEGLAAPFVPLSGTLTDNSPLDYGHLVQRALTPERSPIPSSLSELGEWSSALGENSREMFRTDPGALLELVGPSDRERGEDELQRVRLAYGRRLRDTPGIVSSEEGVLGGSLSIDALEPRLGPAVDAAFETLRDKWELPDGTTLTDGMRVWAAAMQLGEGVYMKWRDVPPPDWMAVRRDYGAAIRRIVNHNGRDLDSPLAVVNAIDAGLYPDAVEILARWREIKDSYEPVTIPVWIDDGGIELAARWMHDGPGIVFSGNVPFAQRLAEVTGKPYYGEMGVDKKTKRQIPEFGERDCGKGAIIASLKSNGEGRNLQGWSRALVVFPPTKGDVWEQLLGRMHGRPGQNADEIEYRVLMSCQAHCDAMACAIRRAQYIQDTTRQKQKLIFADKNLISMHVRDHHREE